MTSIRPWQWFIITAFLCGLGYFHASRPDEPLGKYKKFEIGEMVRMCFSKEHENMFDFEPHSVELLPDPLDVPTKDVYSIKKNGTVAEVTVGDHYYKVGQQITLAGCEAPDYNGTFTVDSVLDVNRFTIKVPEKAPSNIKGTMTSTTQVRLVYLVKGYKVSRERTGYDKNNNPIYEPIEYFCLVDFSEFKAGRIPSSVATATFKPSPMQRLFESLNLKPKDPQGSVLDYLATVQGNNGVKCKYIWWQLPNIQKVIWVGIPLVLFGVFFPILNNVLTYGKLFAPPREKSVSLRKVRGSKPEPMAAHKPTITDEDMRQVEAMGAALEAKLGEDASDLPQAPAEKPQKKEIRKLTDAPTQSLAPKDAQDDNEFGRDSGDFYPTVRGHSQLYKPLGQSGEQPEPEKKE